MRFFSRLRSLPKKWRNVRLHDVGSIGTAYFSFLVIEFLIWNIGLGQKLGLQEYLLPIPAVAAWIVFRSRRSEPAPMGEGDSIVGREGMLRLIARIDEAYSRRIEGFRGVLPAAQVVGPLWPIIALLLAF